MRNLTAYKTKPNTLKSRNFNTILKMSNSQLKIMRLLKKQENVIQSQEENHSIERGPEMTEMRKQAKTLKGLLQLFSGI